MNNNVPPEDPRDKPCPEKKDKDPCAEAFYCLNGPHVEPEAGFWNACARLRLVSIEELLAVTDDHTKRCPDYENPAFPQPNSRIEARRCYFPPYPDPADKDGCAVIEDEYQELVELAGRRDDPCSIQKAFGKAKERRPISRFWNLQPQALGATVAYRAPGQQVIRTGRGLARAVESETPGIYHRHALNFLILRRPGWSPPRQALVWAALDVVIASALQAAWYYKWLSRRRLTSRRERPAEFAARTNPSKPLPVLFDGPDELTPAITRCPTSFKGTPRHPAYPSGHSTYAGAASAFLRFFFGNDPLPPSLRATPGDPGGNTVGRELDNLADNIGVGRMWAGIHWRSDHRAGLILGATVARLVLEQLFATGNLMLCVKQVIPADPCATEAPNCIEKAPPTIKELEARRQAFMDECGKVPEPRDEEPPCPAPIAAPGRTTRDTRREERSTMNPDKELDQGKSGRAGAKEAAQPDQERDIIYEGLQDRVDEDQALTDATESVQRGAHEDGDPKAQQ